MTIMKQPRKVRITDKPLRKIDPKVVGEALGAKPTARKVRMTRQVRMFLQGMPAGARDELVDAIGKLVTGEIGGTPVSPEEIRRLKDEEGLDLEAALREAQQGSDDESSGN
jgi:hypothetical protein